jgi:hypothetical protein
MYGTVGTHPSGRGGVSEEEMMELKTQFDTFKQSHAGSATDFVDLFGDPKAFGEIPGGLKYVGKMLDREIIATPDGPKQVVSSKLSVLFTKTLFSTLPGVPQEIKSVSHGTLNRLEDWKVGESMKSLRHDVVLSINQFIQYYKQEVPAKPVYSVGREHKCLGHDGTCDDYAVDIRCYNVKDLSIGEAKQVLPQITPLCENCAGKFDRSQKMSPSTPPKKTAYRKKSEQLETRQRDLEACQRDLEACQKDLSGRDAELAVRDAEVALLREGIQKGELDYVVCRNQRNDDYANLLVARKELDKSRTELAVKDAQIQKQKDEIKDLKDERRDLEEQLEEALDNSDDKACAITDGAIIMMEEQSARAQRESTDLRRDIDRIRAEHAAFVLVAQRADAATAAASQELERVLSDLSDETYKTAKSTYDSSDEPEPE